jgi:putative ABC transport system permease protein
MFRNYFMTAWRNIVNKKVYTIINVLGLSLGLCTCIVIYLICNYEFSFDSFHPDKKYIYRVMGDVTENTGNKLHFGRLPFAVSQNGNSEISGIDNIAGAIPFNASISIPGDNVPAKKFESKAADSKYITTAIVQPGYFRIFKYQWLAGNPVNALAEPLKVVLTENKAKQYFGNQGFNDIVGKRIVYDDSLTVTVSGIIKDWNKNTDLGFTDFISSSTLHSNYLKSKINIHSWAEPFMNTWTFLKLSRNTSPAKLTAQLESLVKRHAAADVKLSLRLEPLSEVHFNADVIENPIRTAHKPTLYGLMAIALFISILAIINYINLSTAQSIQRAKEVGVRKALGGSRASLISQFLTETLALTIVAVSLAMLLVNPVLATFHSFIPKGVEVDFFNPSTAVFLLLVTAVTSLLAGLYPAKVLSSHLPVFVLRVSGAQREGEKWILRKGLIIFQFVVSLIFIIASIVIGRQLAYTRDKDPGFNANAIVILSTPRGDNVSKISVLAEKVKKISSVNHVALQWLPPMTENARGMQLKFKSNDEKEIEVGQVAGNENFIPLYEIKLLAGRNLEPADTVKEFVINEALLKFMDCKHPQDAIGKILYWNDKPYPVVGVVSDFHIGSFHDLITPLCIINRPERESSLAIKLATKGKHSNTIRGTLSQIERAWKQIYPNATFEYQFYDESLELLYEKDLQTATLVNTAMAITIFISCIGLFGLMLFIVEKRAKEISIRKILGAGIVNIVVMLSKDFVVLVIIALLVASPIAWYCMNQWLQSFAYHIHINGWVFLFAGMGAIFIALITVSLQAIKAAIANPVKSLRTE